MESPCCLGELEEVVGGADHCPLSSDLFEAAQQELAEASGVFDLTKDGLDDLFAQAILNNTAVPTPIEDAVANMQVIDAVIRSSKSGGWV